jgi:transposase
MDRVADLERAVQKSELTDDVLVKRVAEGARWSEVGKPFGMGWGEVKSRFESLAAEGEKAGASQAAKTAAKLLREKNKASAPAAK